MEKEYFTAGELAALAGVSPRTIRFYDKKGLLCPVGYSEGNYRLYDRKSLLQLQETVMLKYIGLSLEEISGIIHRKEPVSAGQLLWEQKKLLLRKREQINRVIYELDVAARHCQEQAEETISIDRLSGLMRLINGNHQASIRFQLHEKYNPRQQEWYPWLFKQLELKPGEHVLDAGAGYGLIWRRSIREIPEGTRIHAVDNSKASMESLPVFVCENREQLNKGVQFTFEELDLNTGTLGESLYDCIASFHMWYYIEDRNAYLDKVIRALKPGGRLCTNANYRGYVPDINRILTGFAKDLDLTDKDERYRKMRQDVEQSLKAHFSQLYCTFYKSRLQIDDLDDLYQFLLDQDDTVRERISRYGSDFIRYLDDYLKVEKQAVIHTESRVYKGIKEVSI